MFGDSTIFVQWLLNTSTVVLCCVLFIGLFVYVYIWQMNQPVRTINITKKKKKNQSNTVHYNPCWPESIIFHHFFLIIHNIRLWMNMIKKRFALLQILVVAVVFEHLNNIVVVYNFSGFKHTKKTFRNVNDRVKILLLYNSVPVRYAVVIKIFTFDSNHTQISYPCCFGDLSIVNVNSIR